MQCGLRPGFPDGTKLFFKDGVRYDALAQPSYRFEIIVYRKADSGKMHMDTYFWKKPYGRAQKSDTDL